jgi:hypothetical protein
MTSLTNYISRLFLILLVSAVSIGSTVAQPAGHLIISRSPNFGWNIAVHLQIDGRDVANIVQGRRYSGFLPAGRHVLTVWPVPNTDIRIPTSTILDVRPGEVYALNAVWDSSLVLFQPQYLTPGYVWQQRGLVY